MKGEALLLDNSVQDPSLRPFLNRPAIRSSMVLPIRVKERVVGVINLAVLNTSATQYTQADIAELEKLLELTSVAFQ